MDHQQANHALSSRALRLLMNQVLSLDTNFIRYWISFLGSKNIFQHLKNHIQVTGDQVTTNIKHKNQILIWIEKSYTHQQYKLHKNLVYHIWSQQIRLVLYGRELRVYKLKR